MTSISAWSTGLLQTACDLIIEKPAVYGDVKIRFSLNFSNRWNENIPGQSPLPVTATADQDALIPLFSKTKTFFDETDGCFSRNHRFEGRTTTVITLEGTVTTRDGESRVATRQAVICKHTWEIEGEPPAESLPGHLPGPFQRGFKISHH